MHCKTVTTVLGYYRIRVKGHLVMSITKNHESRYVTVLDNPLILVIDVGPNIVKKIMALILSNDLENPFNGHYAFQC